MNNCISIRLRKSALLFLLGGCGLLATGRSLGQESGALLPSVMVEKAVSLPNAVDKKYIGEVEAIDSVSVQPRVSGNLLSVHFKEGEKVSKGQLLFELEDTQYKAKVDNSLAVIEQLDLKIHYAEITHERYQKLIKSSSVSQDTVDNSKMALDTLKAEKMAAEAELAIAQDNLDYTKIVSPLTGRVGRMAYSVGNYITPQSGSLLRITSLDEVYVRFPMSDRDVLSLFGTPENLRKQAVVSLTLANGHPYSRKGVVALTDNQAKLTTGSSNIWAKFKNPDEVLIPGGAVTVHLSKNQVENFPAVSLSAIMHTDLKSYVYVLDGENKVVRRDVTLGNMAGNKQLLKSGVKEGELVIVDGMHKTEPGAVVNPVYSKN